MRKYGKVDANQQTIINACRGVGATVQSLASIGNGCPDLLVGYQGKNYLFEVKDGSRPPSARKLTIDETYWLTTWNGDAHIVLSVDDAFKILLKGK